MTVKNFSSLDYRYLLLTVHYRTRLNFTWPGLAAAAAAYERLQNFARGWAEASGVGKIIAKYQKVFKATLEDDLNVPQALAAVWEMSKDEHEKRRDKLATLLDFDQVLGLDLDKAVRPLVIPAEIKKLSEEREIARQKGDWKKADELRQASVLAGYPINDTPTGPKIKRKM